MPCAHAQYIMKPIKSLSEFNKVELLTLHTIHFEGPQKKRNGPIHVWEVLEILQKSGISERKGKEVIDYLKSMNYITTKRDNSNMYTVTDSGLVCMNELGNNKWVTITGWEGGYFPKGECYLEKSCNGFKLRIHDLFNWSGHVSADVNANGCCERLVYGPDCKYERYFDYSCFGSGNNMGYESHERVLIDRDIETVDDLANYLEEYALGLDMAKWVAEYNEKDWMKNQKAILIR